MSSYVIFGKRVPAHILSIGTLATVGLTTAYFMNREGKDKPVKQEVLQSGKGSESDEIDVEKLINNFLKEGETSDEVQNPQKK